MSALNSPDRERLLELIGDRALGTLSPEDAVELESLLVEGGEEIADLEHESEQLVASLVLSQTPPAAMPEGLRSFLSEQGARMMPGGEGERSGGRGASVGPASPWAGWLVAAASLLLAAIGWFRPPVTEPTIPPSQRLASLASEPDTVVLPFNGQGELSESGEVGEIVWNPRLQRGFLRLSDLPGNDPEQQQYQLWIFDAARDPTYPVDGGVFDVTRNGQTEYLVPFVPKLSVGNAAAFAITKEKAGGVVVTDKSGLMMLAPVPTEG